MTNINFIRKMSNINNNNLLTPTTKNKEFDTSTSFKELLVEKSKKVEISFSKHANDRIEERNIGINEDVTNKLNEAVDQAKD